MYKNDSMSVKAKTLAHEICDRIYRHQQPSYHDLTEISPLFSTMMKKTDFGACQMQQVVVVDIAELKMKIDIFHRHQNNNDDINGDGNVDEFAINPWKDSLSKGAIYWLRWPIDILLFTTIPDSRRHKSLFMLTFINCIIWIGICSYLIVYVTTDVGMLRRIFIQHIFFSSFPPLSPVVCICDMNEWKRMKKKSIIY
jgi:hypothetical protein